MTYDITGEGSASVSYLARSVEGKNPAVSIQLGKQGGEARCALSIRGEHRQRATAFGSYGRATCTAELPAQRH
ncbi:hypothetical protein AB0H77_33625 [Streptomyces sp. NPDC050844]|uniref:hypothetical protein n=1 Tax=Streptomyces sp. NPDC050844 TaxID=3155790 RepID=UPI0033CF410F